MILFHGFLGWEQDQPKTSEPSEKGTMTSGPGVAPTTALTADDFLEGLIAALPVRGERQIAATPTELYRAFRRVLSALSQSQTTNEDLSNVDYYPLNGVSG